MKTNAAKFCMAMLLVSLFVSSTITGAAHAATKAAPKTGTLKVEITGLEKSASAKVEVTGPRFKRAIKGPVTLKGLTPGEYLLRPTKVLESNGVESPAPPTVVKVVKGVTTDANANYYFVPNTTLTIPPQQTVSVTGPITGEQTLVLTGSTVAITPGEILASGPTTSRPDGYLLSVTSATVTGAETTIQAEPATLAQAIPDGSLNLQQVFEELNSAFSSGTTETSNARMPHLRSSHDFPSSSLSCNGTGFINVVPSLGFTFTGGSASLGWEYVTTTLKVAMSFSLNASLAVSATAAASCSADVPLLAGDGPPIVIDAGVPIVLIPTYSVDLEGNANVDGTFSQTLDESLGVNMSAQTFGDFSASVTPQSHTSSISANGNASIDLSLIANIGVEVDGLAGVSLDAGPGVNLTVNTASDPLWTLQGCLHGGFTANLAGVNVVDESTALTWCNVLAQASDNSTLVSAGIGNSCAGIAHGDVECWGKNANGELGNGSTKNSSTPVPVSGLSGVTQISSGFDHTCAIVARENVKCWGHLWDNSSSPYAIGVGSSTPVTVAGLSGATQITAGSAFTCALLTSGNVDCWGENNWGQLGNGTTTNSNTPVAVRGLSDVTQIASGSDDTCAIVAGGKLMCWGSAAFGILGYEANSPYTSTPVLISGLSEVTQVAVGGEDICALTSSGTVMCWGFGPYGELGNGTASGNEPSPPVAVIGLMNVTQLTAGDLDFCAIESGGILKCWGDNSGSQLGFSTAALSNVPVAVSGLTGVTQIAIGGQFMCASIVGGVVKCWGQNDTGQLGNGGTSNSATPVTVKGF